jgi:hypothetical protein
MLRKIPKKGIPARIKSQNFYTCFIFDSLEVAQIKLIHIR